MGSGRGEGGVEDGVGGTMTSHLSECERITLPLIVTREMATLPVISGVGVVVAEDV